MIIANVPIYECIFSYNNVIIRFLDSMNCIFIQDVLLLVNICNFYKEYKIKLDIDIFCSWTNMLEIIFLDHSTSSKFIQILYFYIGWAIQPITSQCA